MVEENVTLGYITAFRRVEEQHCGSAKSNCSFQFNYDNKVITEVMYATYGLEIHGKPTVTLCTKYFENQHFKQGHVANL
jgi:hypothetical protein